MLLPTTFCSANGLPLAWSRRRTYPRHLLPGPSPVMVPRAAAVSGMTEEAVLLLESGEVELLTPICLRLRRRRTDPLPHDDQDVPLRRARRMKRHCLVNTTVGRVILWATDHLPKEMPPINGLIKKRARAAALLVTAATLRFGPNRTVKIFDELKELRLFYATKPASPSVLMTWSSPATSSRWSKTPKRGSHRRCNSNTSTGHIYCLQRRALQQSHRYLERHHRKSRRADVQSDGAPG